MSKCHDGSTDTQCPVCQQTATSGSDGSPHEDVNVDEVLEVRPPELRRGEAGQSTPTMEPEFFPLVSAAHEFKTPLVVMLGYADLLRNGQLGPVNAKQRHVLGEIQESAERLQKLIGNLVVLYELRTGKQNNSAVLEPADVNEHVTEIFNYWAPCANSRSIEYTLSGAPRNPRVTVDPLKLQHIISNLIENALKFTPAHGQVRVTITPCFWERRKAQSHFLFNMERKINVKIENAVRIDVSDTGPGIASEHHEHIFGDFVQLPGSSARGTGLGLAIARRLTEAHGGLIWVESEPGKGSRFSVLFSQTR
jgi:two-component system, NarL family, sensor histidine kinase BarA